MTEHTRFNLGGASPSRQPLDASWSANKRQLVAGGAVLFAAAAVAAGVWWTVSTRPPKLPKTAQEAAAVLASAKFDRLDTERRLQYTAEAAKLFRALPDEERQAYFADKNNREAMQKIRKERFDEVARAFARGDKNPFARFRNGRRTGPRPTGDRQNISDEDRAKRRDQMRERIDEQMTADAESGNAQNAGLHEEMMKRRSTQRNSGGGGRGGGGGEMEK